MLAVKDSFASATSSFLAKRCLSSHQLHNFEYNNATLLSTPKHQEKKTKTKPSRPDKDLFFLKISLEGNLKKGQTLGLECLQIVCH